MGESGQRGDVASTEKTATASDTEPPGRSSGRTGLSVLLPQLLSDDLDLRLQSLHEFARRGDEAAPLLVDLLRRTPARSGQYPVIAEALERIGRRAVPALIDVLESLKAPRRAEDIYLLEEIAQILGHISDRRAAPVLARALDALQEAVARAEGGEVRSLAVAAQIRVHRALVELGSREGAPDLLRMLGDGRRRVREELIDLAARVGDKRFLPPLARLYAIEQPVSEWAARLTRSAIREIVRRERIERGDPILAKLDAAAQAFMDRILPKAKGGAGPAGSRPHGRASERHLRLA